MLPAHAGIIPMAARITTRLRVSCIYGAVFEWAFERSLVWLFMNGRTATQSVNHCCRVLASCTCLDVLASKVGSLSSVYNCGRCMVCVTACINNCRLGGRAPSIAAQRLVSMLEDALFQRSNHPHGTKAPQQARTAATHRLDVLYLKGVRKIV